jgi:hypothetical protein
MYEISEPNRPLMTRKELVEHIRGALGIPLKLSTFNKKAMHRETPAPDKYYDGLNFMIQSAGKTGRAKF